MDKKSSSPPIEHTESHGEILEGKRRNPHVEEADYTGAAKVTDPAEAALVSKLDWRIMREQRSGLSSLYID